MSNAPCHRRFSRNVLAAYATEQMRELKKGKWNASWFVGYQAGAIAALQHLYDHFELGKDRRRPQGGTLTRYDPK